MSHRYLLPFSVAAALSIATPATSEEGFWSKAGRDFSEATETVSDTAVDTSKDAWKATKSGAGAAWDKTKEVSSDVWDGTKKAIHDGAEYVEEKTE